MIIKFSVNNWMSFRDQAFFSMIATRERQHKERVPRIEQYKLGILPVAVIYGGNASGKTNLLKALNFARNFVIKGLQSDSAISIEPYKLDPERTRSPVYFSFELLIGETIYEFSFAVNTKAVLEEKLVQISKSSERVLYHRKDNEIQFAPSIAKEESLQYYFRGTQDNQLFLTNSVSQKVNTFRPVYDWFKNSLELVAPDSRFEQFDKFLNEKDPLYATMNSMLPQLDMGIAHVGGEDVAFERLPIPPEMKTRLIEDIKDGETFLIMNKDNGESLSVTRKGEEFTAKKLVTYHLGSDGSETQFDMHNESDGSRRAIDLLPAFLAISAAGSSKVYVVDELDRSLHSLLTRRLLETYLLCCSNKTRSQLLFTTHDVSLMDQQLFRRDEMWATERDTNGATSLIPFSEFKDVRFDKDIRKSYLQGRLGGVPRILSCDVLASACDDQKLSGEN